MSGWRERLDELIAVELEEQAIANSGNIGNFGDAIEPQTDATQKKERSICNSPHFENFSPYPSPYQDAKTAEIAKLTNWLGLPPPARTWPSFVKSVTI